MNLVLSRTTLTWAGFGGYLLLLAAERLLYVMPLGVPVAWLAAGWLAAGMVVLDRRGWLLGLGLALGATVVWYLLIYDCTLTQSLWAAFATGATAFAIGGTVDLVLRPEHRGSITQHVFPLMVASTTIVMLVYVTGSRFLMDVKLPGADFPLANALGVGLGVTTAASVGIILGMPVRRGIRLTVSRALLALASATLLTVSLSVATAYVPNGWFELLSPYEYTWRTLAVVGGVLLTLMIGPVVIAIVQLLIMIGVGFLLKQSILATSVEAGMVLLVEGQALMLGVSLISLFCAALVNAQRRTWRLAAANQEISQWIQQAHSSIPRHVVRARITQVEHALQTACDYCGATVCAIYGAEARGREEFALNIEQVWVSGDPGRETSMLSDPIDSRSYPELREAMSQTEPWFFAANDKRRPRWVQAFSATNELQISIMPIAFDGAVAGAIVMASDPRARIQEFDVNTLLSTIRDHYLGYQNHATAVRSMFIYQRQLRELAGRLSDSAERVRRQTSLELHDGLVQRLAVARMKLGELSIRRVSAPETIDAITKIVDDALSATREIIHELSTSVLYELGLIPALQELTQNLDEIGDVTISLEEHGDRVALSEPLRVMMFTTIRELIENARMHADCKNLWIKLRWDNVRGIAAVEVSDDGTQQGWWLNKDLSADLGLGLAGVSEQLRRFGYELKFDFRPGGGTKAMVV